MGLSPSEFGKLFFYKFLRTTDKQFGGYTPAQRSSCCLAPPWHVGMKSRKSFPLRINPRLYEQLEAWARQEFRSVNGQIEFLLHQAVAKRAKRGQSDLTIVEPAEKQSEPSNGG